LASILVLIILGFSILLVSILYRWRSVAASTNLKDLNFYHDSWAWITKVKICVAWFVHLHACLLGRAYFLLACWLSCHMLLRGREIIKMCAIQLQPAGEQMFLGWSLDNMCLLFSVKLQGKSYVPSHMCHYCHNELGGCAWCD
jgi:hypothetical protein